MGIKTNTTELTPREENRPNEIPVFTTPPEEYALVSWSTNTTPAAVM
jgi:hypothetical protein